MTPEEQHWCSMSECTAARACYILADLNSLVANRRALEADYQWDELSFIGEAKHQFRLSLRCRCPLLDRVRAQAQALAPEVDFDRVT
jgi:hypothetical protein